MREQTVVDLEDFVEKIKANPALLDVPALDFFKAFLLEWGATIPSPPPPPAEPAKEPEKEDPPPAEASTAEPMEADPDEPGGGGEPESWEKEDIEEEQDNAADKNDPERLPEDKGPFPDLGPGQVDLTDAEMDKQCELKQAATEDMEDGNLEDALSKYTRAIEIGNASALMFAKRADLQLKLKRPNGCINDCNAALKLNPDSAKAYKTRGLAYRKLCKWEQAFKDLSTGQKIDFDDSTADVMELVEKKWKKISDRMNKKRIREEETSRLEQERERKRRKAAALKEYEKAKKKDEEDKKRRYAHASASPPRSTGANLDPDMLKALTSHPDLVDILKDEKTLAATMELMEDPASISKHELNVELMENLEKVKEVLKRLGEEKEKEAGETGKEDATEAAEGKENASDEKADANGTSKGPPEEID